MPNIRVSKSVHRSGVGLVGERQEIVPEGLELRRDSDGAGTEKEILEPGKRV